MRMRIGQIKNTQRMVPVLLLVSFLSFGSVSTFAKEKRTVVFEDGWQRLKPTTGKKNTGNFTSFSLLGEPKQKPNRKWIGAWCNWTLNGSDGIYKRGVIITAGKQENDDWLISKEVDLSNCKKPVLDFEGYSKYGTNKDNHLFVLITTNYTGDVETTEWTELDYESFHKFKFARQRRIDLKKYAGKRVRVAFRSTHRSKFLRNLTRTTCLSKVEIKAFKK